MRPFPRPSVQTPLLFAALLAAEVGAASPQLGSLVSPGPLSKAHASLEGLASCEKCHERGKGVSASKCVACHRPVAERIAARRGVHRDVNGDCTSCHVEHAGVDDAGRFARNRSLEELRGADYACGMFRLVRSR